MGQEHIAFKREMVNQGSWLARVIEFGHLLLERRSIWSVGASEDHTILLVALSR
jgi:hypothetical protein